MSKKIFFWAPLLGHVGTINAVIYSAVSLNKYAKAEVYIIDTFGQLDSFSSDYPNLKFIKIFKFGKFLPKTGLASKFCIYFFSIISAPILVNLIRGHTPDILITNLVGVVPLILRPFFKKNCKIINSIQGYPKLNVLRKFLWKNLYKKSDLIITMSNLSREYIINKINIKPSKIVKIDNPVITKKIRLLAREKISSKLDDQIQNNFCITLVGRLTRQKNYISFLNTLLRLNKEFSNLLVLIIGEGELRIEIESFLKDNNIQNVKLLGFKSNPYKYISKSKLFISSSLWEDPGHALIEASYLNIPILTSDCLSGPREIYKDGLNAFVYESNNENEMFDKLKRILQNYQSTKSILLPSKKITKNYTFFNFFKSLNKHVDLR